MNYFIEITNLKDGTTPMAIYSKDSYEAAQMQFHQTLASAMANENVLSCLVTIMGGTGVVSKQEYYVRTIEEPVEG